MDGASLARVRWRMRGAWQWPAFTAMTVVDAVVGHLLPPSGQTQSLPAAALAGLALNLIGVILLSAPLGALLRHFRRDLPRVVARNYAGTIVVTGITAVLVIVGISHHSAVAADRLALREAIARAQAFIGDRAPPQFRRNVRQVSVIEIQEGSVYRACVPADLGARTAHADLGARTAPGDLGARTAPGTPGARTAPAGPIGRTYCVVIDVTRPWARSVRFDGYEPNSVFSEGLG